MNRKTEVPPRTDDSQTDDSQTDDSKIRRYSWPHFSDEESAKLDDLSNTTCRMLGRYLLIVSKRFLQTDGDISDEEMSELAEIADTSKRTFGQMLTIFGNCLTRYSLTTR